MARTTKILLRRGTAAAWAAANPVLAAGEQALETDTNKVKYGNGVTAWNSLAYFGGTATVADGDKGDVIVSSSGSVYTLDPTAVASLNTFTTAAKGLVPAPVTTDATRFLRDDGTWATPGATELPELQQKWSPVSYVYPTGGASGDFWDYIEDQAALGLVGYAIFNPASGPGYRDTHDAGGASSGTHTAYTARLATARAAGVTVLGYVSTNYFDEEDTHSGDPWAGSVAGSYRFTAATSDTITIVDDGTLTTGGTPGIASTMVFEAGFGPVGVKAWSSNLEAGTTLPGGLALSTSYWLRPTGSTPIATYTLHTSKAGAIANTGVVDITSTGGGSGNGPFFLGLRRTPALAVGTDGTILAEIDRYFTLYPDLDGIFFDEALVDLSGYDSVFDAIMAHRDANHPGKLMIFNGTPHSTARVDLYDGFMIENSWANLDSGAEVLPSYLTADTTYSSKAWLGANTVSTNQAAALAFARENNFGHVAISSGGYSGTDLTYLGVVVDGIVDGNETPVEATPDATPTYGSCSYTEGAFTGSAVSGTTFTPTASYAKIACTATDTGALNSQVTFSNTSGGRLTYTGTDAVNVRVSLCMSLMKAAGEEVLATMRIYRSGSGLPDIKASAVLLATKDVKVFNFEYLCTLTTGQYIEPFLKAVRTSDGTTANDDVFTVLHGMMTITPVA